MDSSGPFIFGAKIMGDEKKSYNYDFERLKDENSILKEEINKLKVQLDQAIPVSQQIDQIFHENMNLANKLRLSEALNDDLHRRLRIALQKNEDQNQNLNIDSLSLSENDSIQDKNINSVPKQQIADINSKLQNQILKQNEQIAKFNNDISNILQNASKYFNCSIESVDKLNNAFNSTKQQKLFQDECDITDTQLFQALKWKNKFDHLKSRIMVIKSAHESEIQSLKESYEIKLRNLSDKCTELQNTVENLSNQNEKLKKNRESAFIDQSREIMQYKVKINELESQFLGEKRELMSANSDLRDKLDNEIASRKYIEKQLKAAVEKEKSLNLIVQQQIKELNDMKTEKYAAETRKQVSPIQIKENEKESKQIVVNADLQILKIKNNRIEDLEKQLNSTKFENEQNKIKINDLINDNKLLAAQLQNLQNSITELKRNQSTNEIRRNQTTSAYESKSNQSFIYQNFINEQPKNEAIINDIKPNKFSTYEINESSFNQIMRNQFSNEAKINEIIQNQSSAYGMKNFEPIYSNSFNEMNQASVRVIRNEMKQNPEIRSNLIDLAINTVEEFPIELRKLLADKLGNCTLNTPTKLTQLFSIIAKWYNSQTSRITEKANKINVSKFGEFDFNSQADKQILIEQFNKMDQDNHNLNDELLTIQNAYQKLLDLLNVNTYDEAYANLQSITSESHRLQNAIKNNLKDQKKKESRHEKAFIKNSETIDELNNQISQLNAQNSKLKGQISQITDEKEELERRLNFSEKAFSSKIDEIKLVSQTKVDEIVNANQQLLNTLAGVKAELKILTERNDKYKQESHELRQIKSKLLQKVEKLQDKNNEMIHKFEVFNNGAQMEHQFQMNSLKEQNMNIIQSYDEEISRIRSQNQSLSDEMAKINSINSELTKTNSELSLTNQKLELEVAELRSKELQARNMLETRNECEKMSQKFEIQKQIDSTRDTFEIEKRKIIGFVAKEFSFLFDPSQSLNELNFETFITNIQKKFVELLNVESKLRILLKLGPKQSIVDAVSLILLH